VKPGVRVPQPVAAAPMVRCATAPIQDAAALEAAPCREDSATTMFARQERLDSPSSDRSIGNDARGGDHLRAAPHLRLQRQSHSVPAASRFHTPARPSAASGFDPARPHLKRVAGRACSCRPLPRRSGCAGLGAGSRS
jgi:hypothetical protein